MDLKVAIMVAALAASVYSVPVPPSSNGPKYVPVFVSSEALNNLNDKEGQNKPIGETGEPSSPQGSNGDFDMKKEIQQIFNGPPAPVYEHQPDQHSPSYSSQQYQNQLPQQNYQNQQPQILPQYQNNQQLIAQPYQVNQQPIQPPYQINQQPNQIQQYQVSQPGQPQLFQLNQQPGQLQPITVTQPNQQPIYGNQQQILTSQQPLGQQAVISQQPMLLNRQQLVPQQVQTYQQPNQLLITSQPAGNQQAILAQSTQPILLNQQPNQQAILLQQPNQNGQPTLITSNINPINLGQPNNQLNPGYIPNQNQNVYTVVPLNQNVAPSQNIGTNTYLVPVQQLPNTIVQQAPSQIYAVNSG